ncbi:hypothetical protein [Microbacterium sp. CH12i]|uniref:hypothetical protein n=1 Tax=Microbacterium sp. CH12i TaxID=1479651 RepID=UPI000566D4BD|nr:hypothetical protein [Microbacterium sp. CH12i]
MEEAQTSIVELVDARLRSDDSARDRRGVEEEARMIVSMTFGITHYLARDLIASGSFDNADELLQRAIALARKVVTD